MCIASHYIKESGDKELLRMLLEIFENEREEKDMRKLAYECIANVLGKDWMKLPEVNTNTFPKNAIAQEIIAKAHELLAKNEENHRV